MVKALALTAMAVGLISACAVSPPTPAAAPVPAPSVLASASGSGTITETTSSDGRGSAELTTRFTTALRLLEAAPTVEYTIESVSEMGADGIRIDRDVKVDMQKQRASTRVHLRADVPGKPKTDGTLIFVNTADQVYVTSPGWTGARRGKWLLLTEASAAQMGVPLDLSAPTSTPPGLDGFQVTGAIDKETFEGKVEAEPGLKLLGLAAALKDPDTRDTLTGAFRSWVTLDPDSGQIVEMRVAGMGNMVSFTSDPTLRESLEQSLSITTATVRIKQTGEPVTITVPAAKDLIKE